MLCFTIIIIVQWTVLDTSSKLGQDLTLFCKVDNCTVHKTKRWYGGPDDNVLMVNQGTSMFSPFGFIAPKHFSY
jgi:hypothetical protein